MLAEWGDRVSAGWISRLDYVFVGMASLDVQGEQLGLSVSVNTEARGPFDLQRKMSLHWEQ